MEGESAMDQGWTAYIILGLGLFALWFAWRSISSGEIEGDFGSLKRAQSPVTFWLLAGFVLLCGLGLSAAGAFVLLYGIPLAV
jgi:hypothetical protein